MFLFFVPGAVIRLCNCSLTVLFDLVIVLVPGYCYVCFSLLLLGLLCVSIAIVPWCCFWSLFLFSVRYYGSCALFVFLSFASVIVPCS